MSTTNLNPSTNLIIKRGWYDPLLYFVLVFTVYIFCIFFDNELNAKLESVVGYSGTRITLITLGVMVIWGTVQGFREKVVVYINDEITPDHLDSIATIVIVVGPPIVTLAFCWLFKILFDLLAPSGVDCPDIRFIEPIAQVVMWLGGFGWLYARLYYYNKNALSAAVALVTKVFWCVGALFFLFQTFAAFDRFTQGIGTLTAVLLNFLIFMHILWVIEMITYQGPSLRSK